MTSEQQPVNKILEALQERAKELNCLYRVDEILSQKDVAAEDAYQELIQALPPGWQYPDICQAKLSVAGRVYQSATFEESPWSIKADIIAEGEKIGEIAVYYSEKRPPADEGPFLKEERRLIDAIAERLGVSIMQRRLRRTHQSWETAVQSIASSDRREWGVLFDFLLRTDSKLLLRLTRKMINYLCSNGVAEAEQLLQESLPRERPEQAAAQVNRPTQRGSLLEPINLTRRTFEIAARHLSEGELISSIQNWIHEEKSSFLIRTLERPESSLAEIHEAMERFHGISIQESELPLAAQKSLRVSLLRRFFTDQLDYINVAKQYVDVEDFHPLLQHLIYPSRSQGVLGGKSAGLFLASQVVRKSPEYATVLGELKIPKTWYVTSDGLIEFVHYNNLEDLHNRKYMEIEAIRNGYPHIVQIFKNSLLPPEIVRGLALALDDFEQRPLIVRSSSLLEDRTGSSFSGKYKSLFLANQGSKRQRLEALQDAILEVYASVFAPDPIEYRAERGLLDISEEMGIMIQEVVGQQLGRYFLPAFSGVAFSDNEFRWSARIRRQDGLVRLVPGLGTRAVDRLSDDYPVLAAPGQPGLRVNVTVDEIVRYSPRKIDVINIESNCFETITVHELMRQCGSGYPLLREIVSVVDHDRIRRPTALEPDFAEQEVVVSFNGLITETPFMTRIRSLLKLLREKIGWPVDIEFACDGTDFYLLQCRAQSYSEEHAPAPIPPNLPREQLLFTANRYISNGRVPDITHIVYVDPESYGRLSELKQLKEVGRAIGRLNSLLPKRQFLLLGPGRWGSRGDIKLGVSVGYSDINNTAVLGEIARARGSYVPDLSFGTHFFQDLVEAGIRYLPLYPDRPDVVFQERFLLRARNILPDILPEYAHLADTVRVIDVPSQTGGQVLRVLLNAELDQAVGLFAAATAGAQTVEPRSSAVEAPHEEHWRWRLRMAEQIAAELDPKRFGVKALYVFGSTKNASAGPGSDIDLIVHVSGDGSQHAELQLWLEGWSLALAEMNYLRTGYRSLGLLDVHWVTDQDIAQRTSFAAKIDAITDAARPLPLGSRALK